MLFRYEYSENELNQSLIAARLWLPEHGLVISESFPYSSDLHLKESVWNVPLLGSR